MHPRETHTHRYTQIDILVYIYNIHARIHKRITRGRVMHPEETQTLPNRKRRICASLLGSSDRILH